MLSNHQILNVAKEHPRDIKKAWMMAIIVKRSTIISIGYNRRRFHADGKFTWHAEESAIDKAGMRAKGADMYIYRIRKTGRLELQNPCKLCIPIIKRAGIRNIHGIMENNTL